MSNGFMRVVAGACVAALLTLASCEKEGSSPGTTQPAGGTSGGGAGGKVAYITNGIDPFWDTAVGGARVGAKEFGLQLDVQKPAKGVPDQNRILESMLAKGT